MTPVGPIGLSLLLGPRGPCRPVAEDGSPVGPTTVDRGPVGPVGPVGPMGPGGPVGPVRPVGPVTWIPDGPDEPVGPVVVADGP